MTFSVKTGGLEAMFENVKFILEYKLGANKKCAEGLENDDYKVEAVKSDDVFQVTIRPKKSISFINAYLVEHFGFLKNDRVFANGYQSWTTTREYKASDVQRGLRSLGAVYPVRPFTALFGDYDFQKYSKKPGVFHSYSYTYVNSSGNVTLLGSLNERTGYTIFHVDMNCDTLRIQKDVEGVTTDKEYVLFELYESKGGYDEVFDDYFAKLAFPKPRFDHMSGYTSWYNYYGGISENQIMRDLEGLARVGDAANVFQIDDGFQSKVGDWYANEKFPGKMKNIVDATHAKGYKAGLWLAPLNAAKTSVVAKEHKDWFIRCPRLPKREIGVIGWGGGYTFDIYNPEVREYIKGFFNRVLNEWGFDMVKLDFLYSACRHPRNNKSRGELMYDAMEFLRECVGDKIILGCGVPLFPAFGYVDFCRISCDVAPTYREPFYNKMLNRELPSAKNAINNTIFRRHLNGRIFGNDPDVFYLRERDLTGKDEFFNKRGKHKFTRNEQLLLAEINNTFGNVLFVSDNVGGYSEETLELLKKFFKPTERKIIDAEYVTSSEIEITYSEADGKVWKLRFDVYTGENSHTEIK